MKYSRSLSILASFMCMLCSQTYAAHYFKHLPFDLTLNKSDTLVADYDYTASSGITCTSDSKNVWVDFVYKGHDKSVALPVIMINNHIPKKPHEELSNISGQFTLHMDENAKLGKKFTVSCDYSNQ